MGVARIGAGLVAAALSLLPTIGAATAYAGAAADERPAAVRLPTPNVGFDYQIGGAFAPAPSVGIVSRDRKASPSSAPYDVCYVNAFQTEATPGDPDHEDNWPPGVVWDEREDPDWPGEHPIDIGTNANRRTAAEFVNSRLEHCAQQGFDAVELDNLDTFTRYPDAPFDEQDAIAYARLLVEFAIESGLAVGQKNTPELLDVARTEIGFGFAIVEECGAYDECQPYVDTYEGRVYDVEYTAEGLAAACEAIGDVGTVIQRDRDLVTPDDPGYVFATC